MSLIREQPASSKGWLPDLYRLGGVAPDASLHEARMAMEALAKQSAPAARGGAGWLLIIQAISVLAPVAWILRRPIGFVPELAAVIAFVPVLVLISALWWTRWRGIHRTWARARLVVEIARSREAAAGCPGAPFGTSGLEEIPEIRPLLDQSIPAEPMEWPQWRAAWIKNRVVDQLRYYCSARQVAKRRRRHITRMVTLMTDLMIAVAIAGLVVAFSGRGQQWLRLLGDRWLEIGVGLGMSALALGIVLLQSLRSVWELNTRVGRFSRQIEMLASARKRLLAARSSEEAIQVAEATEANLLREVVDWYFEAEHGEQFFASKESAKRASLQHRPIRIPLIGRVVTLSGLALFFLSRILLGRAPWIIGSSVATIGLLSYNSAKDASARSWLGANAQLLGENGQPWEIEPSQIQRGCIIIAHGLHDSAQVVDKVTGRPHWMSELSSAIRSSMGEYAPNIGLVDWRDAARPSDLHDLKAFGPAGRWIGGLGGIPSQAREVGDALAFRLSQWIEDKKIDPTKGIHFIGHSAGGFVVARAALRLKRYGLVNGPLQVTILDTPEPSDELLVELPKVATVDFYVTSPFVLRLDYDARLENRYLQYKAPPAGSSALQAHSFAHEWYISTVASAPKGADGFGRSMFADRRAEATGAPRRP
jgi:pimeloyl-ACP methyl ester carboxylesterase